VQNSYRRAYQEQFSLILIACPTRAPTYRICYLRKFPLIGHCIIVCVSVLWHRFRVEEFAEAVGRLGLENHDAIVCYDSLGIFSAPRVWWTFRVL
jgi:hypothetical protein